MESRSLSREQVIRTFEHMRQTGSLPVVLAVLAQNSAMWSQRLLAATENLAAESPGAVREYGKLQGRLAETNRLLRVFESWSRSEWESKDLSPEDLTD